MNNIKNVNLSELTVLAQQTNQIITAVQQLIGQFTYAELERILTAALESKKVSPVKELNPESD